MTPDFQTAVETVSAELAAKLNQPSRQDFQPSRQDLETGTKILCQILNIKCDICSEKISKGVEVIWLRPAHIPRNSRRSMLLHPDCHTKALQA